LIKILCLKIITKQLYINTACFTELPHNKVTLYTRTSSVNTTKKLVVFLIFQLDIYSVKIMI